MKQSFTKIATLTSLINPRVSGIALALLTTLSFSVATQTSAEAFEGRVKMSFSEGTSEHSIDYYAKGDRMRIDMDDPRMQGGAMIMNMEKKEILMLMPEQRMYMTMPMPDVGPGEETEGEVPEATGETRTILGHTAHQYKMEEGGAEYEVWATDELGTFSGFHLPEEGRPGAPSPRERAFAGKDFFPLLIIERHGGRETTRVEVTEVEQEELPDSLFEAPAGFRGINVPFQAPQ